MKRSSSNKEYVSVYRIEKRGRGPYCSEKSAALMTNWFPTPQYDSGFPEEIRNGTHIIDKYRFGSVCKNTLIGWMDDPLGLHNLGYKISLYKADKATTISSDIQSMFLKRKAKKVKEWEIVEFMKGEKKTYA